MTPLDILATVACLYFLPTLVVKIRGAKCAGGVFVLNLFLGWTVIGWLAGLIWAASTPKKAAS
jgi:uncharacterized membrane protein YqaE (UPF0057 family)